MISIQYITAPQSSTAYLALNAGILSSSFANVGYVASENSFKPIYFNFYNVQAAPVDLMIPFTATNSIANT